MIDPLTSLRFFAAGAIVYHHLQGKFGLPLSTVNVGIAVSFFFVLSGFILCYVYSDIDNAGKARRFYLARFARIWPLHAATLLFAALVLTPGYTDHGAGAFVANALLLQSWWPSLASCFPYNWLSWSISNEAFFYLLFPLVMLWRRQFGAIFFAWVALLLAVFLVGGNLEPTPPPATATNVAGWYILVQMGPAVRFFEFLFGMGVGLVYLKHKNLQMPLWAWSLIEVLAVAAVVVYATTIWQVLYFVAPGLGNVFIPWYGLNGGFLVFGFAILCFAYRGGLLSRLLSLPFFVLLGEISFSTYMIHQLVIRFWEGLGWLATDWSPLGLAGILTTIYVGSYLSWRFFERPAQRAILALGQRRAELASAPELAPYRTSVATSHPGVR